MTIELPEGYKPNQKEDYMSQEHLEYFRQKLLILARRTAAGIRKHDFASQRKKTGRSRISTIELRWETDAALELRTRDRYRKLVNKIDSAAVARRRWQLRILR